MRPRTTSLPLAAAIALLAGCGGATSPAPEVAPATVAAAPSGPAMTGAWLTTAVDARGEAAAPAATAFGIDTERIHLVADLTGLPPATAITVDWVSRADGESRHRTRDTVSGDQRLVAVFPAPPGGFFEAGDYEVAVRAGETPLGRVEFRIGGRTSDWTGVRGLAVAAAVAAWTHEAIEPRSSFPAGTRRVYAVFQVRTTDPRPFVRLTWLQGERELAASDLECGREVLCVDSWEKGGRVPPGDYEVEVSVNGEVMARRSFHVGGDPVSPLLLHAALGVAAGKQRQMPKRHSEVFEGRVRGLRCGVRFSTLPERAVIEVVWARVTDGGEEELHRGAEVVEGGGTRTAVIDWPLEDGLEPGRYKATVSVGPRRIEELAFTVR